MTETEKRVVTELVEAATAATPLPGNRGRLLLPDELRRLKDAAAAVRKLLERTAAPSELADAATDLAAGWEEHVIGGHAARAKHECAKELRELVACYSARLASPPVETPADRTPWGTHWPEVPAHPAVEVVRKSVPTHSECVEGRHNLPINSAPAGQEEGTRGGWATCGHGQAMATFEQPGPAVLRCDCCFTATDISYVNDRTGRVRCKGCVPVSGPGTERP